jgi:hypothetical protein
VLSSAAALLDGLFEHPAQALSYSAIYLNQALMGKCARMR